MRITVRGKSRFTRKFYTDLVEWFAVKICGPRLANALDFLIVLQGRRSYYAECECDDEESRPDRPRKFKIIIDATTSERCQICAIAHELVHVKQYARGILDPYISGDDRIRWKNRVYVQHSKTYRRLPWEVEARSYEKPMYIAWRKFVNEQPTT